MTTRLGTPQADRAQAEQLARARAENEELHVLLKVRALLATAEASEFQGEARSFRDKALSLAARYEIEPALLLYPREDLKVAVVMAELTRLREIIRAYGDEPETWETKSVEWSQLLDEFDGVLEVACDILCLPLRRLPYGCRRHFRPHDRARIEALIEERVTSMNAPREPTGHDQEVDDGGDRGHACTDQLEGSEPR
jgi:hypothetical protein